MFKKTIFIVIKIGEKMKDIKPEIINSVFPVSVDPVIFSIEKEKLHVLLIKRKSETFNNTWGLPGGLMHSDDKTLEDAIGRVLTKKTGAKVNYVEQLCTRTGHDPRGPTISIAYIALVDQQSVLSNAVWTPVEDVVSMELAFDHKQVIEQAVARLTNKVNYSTLPMHFLPQPFTLPKLQQIYEILLGEKLDKSTFRKKIDESGVIEETGEQIKEGAYRPAKLYRLIDNGKVFNFNSNIIR
jgi:hypothetical protein